MLDSFYELASPVAATILALAIMLLMGFAMTRITKLLRLPNVTAYILTGILIGPYALDLIPETVVSGMEFLPDLALAFIAFGVGEFFKFSALKKNGAKVIFITLTEAITAALVVFSVLFFLLKIHFCLAIVLAALAPAMSPASIVMIIRQTKSKGDFVDTLLQVIALDDVISLVAYSVALSVSLSFLQTSSSGDFQAVVVPILINIGVLILGGFFGLFMKALMPKKRSTDNKLIISIALLLTFCGICTLLDVSPLLGCMSMGMLYTNTTNDDKLFKQLNYFSPPILLLFFVRSGIGFNLGALFSGKGLFWIGVVYFIVRFVGKYLGSYISCRIVKKSPKVYNFLGLALLPQAGVAIGLAALGARILPDEMGSTLQTIVLSASILYEIAGPVCAKMALYLSGSYSDKLEDITDVPVLDAQGQRKSEVALLAERIQEIRRSLQAANTEVVSEEEKAFLDAAEEQYEVYRSINTRHRMRR